MDVAKKVKNKKKRLDSLEKMLILYSGKGKGLIN